MSAFQLNQGDCLATLQGMADSSVDSCVVDPPYGLSDHRPAEVVECLRAWLAGEVYTPKGKGFMGKSWDAWVPGPEVWREVLRVLKPGGHLLAFAGTRSMDLMSMAVRLAGFELRDAIGNAHDGAGAPLAAWVYGSGFPKSLNVSKAIDKAAGAEREVIGVSSVTGGRSGSVVDDGKGYTEGRSFQNSDAVVNYRTAAATDPARQWEGWGSQLKPAWEPIIMARKPLAGTIVENVLAHGTGGLNIDACRVETTDDLNGGAYAAAGARAVSGSLSASGMNVPGKTTGLAFVQPAGRFPANVVHDGSDDVLKAFPSAPGQQADASSSSGRREAQNTYGAMRRGRGDEASADSENVGAVGFKMKPGARRHDAGSAARFFYCAKASPADRHEGLASPGPQFAKGSTLRDAENLAARGERKGNHHPTVKPTALMRYLVRLVTPPGGTVLDPFMGSGSTGKACALEGLGFIGCELDPAYVEIARARIAWAHQFAAEEAARVQEADAQADLFGKQA